MATPISDGQWSPNSVTTGDASFIHTALYAIDSLEVAELLQEGACWMSMSPMPRSKGPEWPRTLATGDNRLPLARKRLSTVMKTKSNNPITPITPPHPWLYGVVGQPYFSYESIFAHRIAGEGRS